jgi:hypothetical protein
VLEKSGISVAPPPRSSSAKSNLLPAPPIAPTQLSPHARQRRPDPPAGTSEHPKKETKSETSENNSTETSNNDTSTSGTDSDDDQEHQADEQANKNKVKKSNEDDKHESDPQADAGMIFFSCRLF